MQDLTDIRRLPPPGPDAAKHSDRVSRCLRKRIAAAGGGIPFDTYMQTVLYEPGLGYYMAGAHKFGADGDFITAPELASVFARCLAHRIAPLIATMPAAVVVEFGGGSGALARDLLNELAGLDRLPARYVIVEPSAELRGRQQQLLAADTAAPPCPVEWWQVIPDDPVEGVVIANEVLDAMPVKRFSLRDRHIYEQHVGIEGDALRCTWRPASAQLRAGVRSLLAALPATLPDGYESEFNVRFAPWLAAATGILSRGMVLLCDYGYPRHEYYHPQRTRGTLICHYRHRAHEDPLLLPGLQDISAFVDFTAVADELTKLRFELAAYTTQAAFVLASLPQVPDGAPTPDNLQLANVIKTLTLPGAMGEKFKIMAATRGVDGPFADLARMDQRRRLVPLTD